MEQVAAKPSLTLSRHYPVAPEKVWRAWTDPEAIKRWFGPEAGEPVAAAELDVRAGGRFRIVFGGPDGKMHECAGVYKEVVPCSSTTVGRLVFTWSWPRTTPERISVVTIEFRAAGRGTDLVFKHEQFFDEQARDGHKQGWSASFDKLAAYLAAETST
jgi:uncharacterized protein YndB with AHSA1/START domain